MHSLCAVQPVQAWSPHSLCTAVAKVRTAFAQFSPEASSAGGSRTQGAQPLRTWGQSPHSLCAVRRGEVRRVGTGVDFRPLRWVGWGPLPYI